MRSFGSTLILAIVAAVVCGLAALQWSQGSFDLIFGKPPTPLGDHLYTSFQADQVKHIHIRSNGTKASFQLHANGWHATQPYQDRMDPVAAVAIVRFTLGMQVEDLAGESKVDPTEAGLGDNAVIIRLEDEHGEALARYKVGRVSPWKAEREEADGPINTLFVQPIDEGRGRHIYLCTGDITPLFKEGLKLLRDHRPLYFNPLSLQQINIHSQQGDLTIGRQSPQHAWRITKPLDLPTDRDAMQRLIEGLYSLRASQVSDRDDVTLPTTGTASGASQISISSFGSETETILDIFPAESLQSQQVMATVSDRPGTVFELPLKPAPDLVSLADLPIDVNALRDPTLTHLNIASLRAIAIIPSTGGRILITREPPQPWMAEANGRAFQANEQNLYALLKAVTTTKTTGFVSDAATDFAPWGLDRPILRLQFMAANNQVLELRFGINLKGEYFVNRLGTASVMRVDPALIRSIAIRPYEWKHSRLWSLNRVNLSQLLLKKANGDPLILKYDFIEESWNAQLGGEDVSSRLIPSKANYMLGHLEGMHVSRWLAAGDEAALQALLDPEHTITAMEAVLDEDGNRSGFSFRTITLAPVSSGPNLGDYYGLLNTEPHPFIVDRQTVERITVNLFDE